MELTKLADCGDYQQILDRQWTQNQLDKQDEYGRTALMRAAIRGDYSVANALKLKGANVHLYDKDRRKAVNLAALYGHSAILALLIEGGCGG